MHEYSQPHETNLNIKKKWLLLLVEMKNALDLTLAKVSNSLLLAADEDYLSFLHDKFKLLQTIFYTFYKFIICFFLVGKAKKANE